MLCVLFVCPMTAYAGEVGGVTVSNPPEWQDIDLTEDEINEIFEKNPKATVYASGLIVAYNIAISGSGSNINLVAKTVGAPGVIKAGYTEVVIQQRKNSSSSWSTYVKYNDLYVNTHSYNISKSISATKGYQYRATCVHYAKKSLLSTQKISDVSNIITL